MHRHPERWCRIRAVWAVLLAAVLPAYPQQQAPPAPTLKVFVLQGNNVVNDLAGRSSGSSTPIVEVRDLNDQPVEGADVIFELPSSGPGGSFPGNRITYSTRTTPQGQASAPFTPNTLPGRFTIQVTATSADRFGRVVIQQSNAAVAPVLDQTRGGGLGRKKWLIIGGIAAGAAVGIALALTHGSNSTPPAVQNQPPVLVITPGTPVFGGR